MSDEPRCGNCRFYLITGPERVCRRFPPQATFIAASGTGATITPPQTISYFPGMQETGWCGCHEPKTTGQVITLVPTPGDGSLAK